MVPRAAALEVYPVMAHVLSDIRYAWRGLRKAPVFTGVAILSMALGIGANTAIFTLVDQVLLRLLPVENPRQLVLVTGEGFQYGNGWGDGNELSYPRFVDLRDNNSVFSAMFCRFSYVLHVGHRGQTERIAGELVSGGYFSGLGVNARFGRLIGPQDETAAGADRVAVISHAYWQSRFASDPAIVGKTIVVANEPMTVIGVAQEGFDGVNLGRASQLFVPITMAGLLTPLGDKKDIGKVLQNRRQRWLNVFGRLRDGITPEQAQASLQPFYASRLQMEVQEAAFARASVSDKERFVKGTVAVQPAGFGKSSLRRQLTRPLWILMAIVGMVLLIACANVANLLFARATARQREIVVRLALGATRRRIVQQLLIESLLLAIAGGAVGLTLAALGTSLLLDFFRTPNTTLTVSASPDLRILGFTLAISIATGLLFGLIPALRSTQPELAPTLKNEAGSVLGGAQAGVRKALVVSQVALSLLLLIGAGLFVRSLHNLMTVNTGIEVSRLIEFYIEPSVIGYEDERGAAFAKAILARVRGVPGVMAAGLGSNALFEGGSWNSTYTLEGYTPKGNERVVAHNNTVSPGYFATLGMRLVAGRDFGERDEQPQKIEDMAPWRTAITNQAFVRKYMNGNPASALGRHFGFGRDPGTPTPIEIVGVVSDAKYRSMRGEVEPQMFFPRVTAGGANAIVYVRTAQDPNPMFQTLRRVLRELEPKLPISGMQTFEDRLERSLTNERLVANLSIVFGVLATLLAMIGLYGVMAYSVTRRTREIGIRMALGALSSNVARMILREVAILVAIGIVIALPAAWASSRYIASQLYEVTPTDPATIVIAIAGLVIVAAAAGLIPALRAARVNPITALRHE
jgi:predicted permease